MQRLFALMFIFCFALPVFGQGTSDGPKKGADKTVDKRADKGTEKAIEKVVEKETPKVPVLERNYIYIPYQNFSKVLENQPQGVFLPLSLFQELLASFYRVPQVVPQTTPFGYALSQARYKAKVEEGILSVDLSLQLETFQKGWTRIPLLLPKTAITSFELGAPHYLLASRRGYSLLVQGPGKFMAKAKFFTKIQKKEKLRSISFQGPEVGMGTFEITVPGQNHTFTSDQSLFVRALPKKDHTLLNLFLPPQGNFSLHWQEKKKEIPLPKGQIEALSIVQSNYSLEGEQHKVTLRFEVFGGTADTFNVKFPSSYEYSFIGGQFLSMIPDPQEDGKTKRLVLKLNRPIKKEYTFQFQLEQRYLKLPTRVSPPEIQVEGARQIRGYLVLYSSGEAEATPFQYKGFTRTSFQPLQNLVSPSSPYVFFYTHLGTQKGEAQLIYKLAKKKPEIEPQLGLLAQLEENRLRLQGRIYLKIRKARLLSFQISLPRGYDNPYIMSENGTIEKLGPNAQTGGTNFEIVLNKAADAAALVELEAHRPYPAPCAAGKTLEEKKDPTYKKHLEGCADCKEWAEYQETKALPLPWMVVLEGVQPKGFLSVAARSKYNLEVTRLSSLLRDTPSEEEGRTLPAPAGTGKVYSTYRILKFPYSLHCRLIPKDPKVFVSVNSLITLKERLFQIHTTLKYKIFDAGITQVTFRLPSSFKAEDIRVEGDFIRSSLPPKGKEKDWKVVFQKEILGEYHLKIFYEREIQSLPLGKLSSLPTFEVEAREGKYHPSYLALAKEGNVNFYFVEKNLKEMDVAGLPEFLKKEKPFRAYEILGRDFSLKTQAMKLEYAPVLNTVVEHFHLDGVLNRDGTFQNQFYLTVKNNGRQYLNLKLPKGFQSLLVEVEGRPLLRPPRGKTPEDVLINILNLPSSQQQRVQDRIRIRGRYTLQGSKLGLKGLEKLSPPNLGGVPITLYTWDLYLPRGYSYREFGEDYVHSSNPKALLGYLQRLVGGEASFTSNQQGKVYQLKSQFAQSSGFFQNIVLDGQRFSFYLPGPQASDTKGLPPLPVSYLGKKTTYFLYFLSLLLTAFFTLLLVRFLPFRKTSILTGEGVFVVLISLVLSTGYQGFLLASLLALAGCGLFWTGNFVLVESARKGSGTPSAKEESREGN